VDRSWDLFAIKVQQRFGVRKGEAMMSGGPQCPLPHTHTHTHYMAHCSREGESLSRE